MGKKGIPGGNPKSKPFWVLPLANAACAGRCQEGWVLCGPTACPLSPWPAGGGEGEPSQSQGRPLASRVREGWGSWGLHAQGRVTVQGSRCSPRASVVALLPFSGCRERPGLTPDFPACLFIPGSVLEAAAKHSVPATLYLTGLRACLGGPAPGRCGFLLWTIMAFMVDICKNM